MATKKDIGTAFKESLANYKDSPDDMVWENIEKDLKKKKDRKGIIFWWFAGLGVLAIALFVSKNVWIDTTEGTDQQIIQPKEETTTDKLKTDPILDENSKYKNENLVADEELDEELKDETGGTPNPLNYKSSVETPINTNTSSKTRRGTMAQSQTPSQLNTSDYKHNTGNENWSLKEQIINDSTATVTQADKITELNTNTDLVNEEDTKDTELIADTDQENEMELPDEPMKDSLSKKDRNKWSFSAYPILNYYDSFSNNSVIDSRLDGNNKTQDVTISYGAFFSYHSNSRFSIRIGANKLRLNQTTKGIDTSNVSLFNLSHVKLNSSIAEGSQLQNFLDTNNNIELRQELEYLEIPLELRYKFRDKKLSLAVIGGVSFMHLLDNTITAEGSNNSIILGEASNINNINLSLNLGLGLQVKLFRKFYFNVEPLFKYQIKPFNDSNSAHPFIISVQTGIEYKF